MPQLISSAGDREQGQALFIDKDRAEELKKLGTVKDSKISLTVSNDFVNGLGKNKTGRWLVYHDKTRSMYQVGPMNVKFELNRAL